MLSGPHPAHLRVLSWVIIYIPKGRVIRVITLWYPMPTSVPAPFQEAHVEQGRGILHCSARRWSWLKKLKSPGPKELWGAGGQLWACCRGRAGLQRAQARPSHSTLKAHSLLILFLEGSI